MKRIIRIGALTLALFVAFNVTFALANPMPWLARVSGYNWIFPGRARLPFGAKIEDACNLVVNDLDAMFASHEIARPKPADEYRVALVGDSSVWGVLLEPEQTLSAQLNALNLGKDGKRVRFYNLGYPDFSLAKDVLVLNRALRYEPDAIVWLTTLNSFPSAAQSSHNLVQANASEAVAITGVAIAPSHAGVLDRTIVGQRRNLADLARLQLCGVFWAATGRDQRIRSDYERWTRDLEADKSFGALQPPTLREGDVSLGLIGVGRQLAERAGAKLLMVNEPIAVSAGANSDVRYNAFYPRWAYDQFRDLLKQRASAESLPLLDAWNLIAPDEFTNSPVHLTPNGTALLARAIADALAQLK